MKNYKLILLVLLSVVLTSSCKKFVEGVNDNPNSFTDMGAELIIGQAQMAAIATSESQTSRFAGIFTDQFTGHDRQFIPYDKYDVPAANSNDIWSTFYHRGATQAKLAMEKAIEENNTPLEGVSEIFYAYFIAETAILFGDVPNSEAFDEENPNPHYDAQATVIDDAIAKLTDALTKVSANQKFNRVFVSNNFNWVEVAHSLKARYYLAKKDYTNALSEAQQGISAANKGLFAEHDRDAGKKNLYYQFCVEQRGGYLTAHGSGANQNSGSTLKRWLITRPSGLTSPGDAQRDAKYFDSYNLNTGDDGYFAKDAPFPIVSWVETKLIEAEAAQRTGGDALTPFNAVRSHLETEYNIGGGFPASSSSGNQLLKEILEEKYLSLIGSVQVFQDIRRTDNLIGVQVKGTGHTTIPQRFLYPQTEINANSNFPGLVDMFAKTPINQ